MKTYLLSFGVAIFFVIVIIVLGSLFLNSSAGIEVVKVDLPDPILTPGSIDLAVTPDNVKETVCVRGYASDRRPSNSDSLKNQVIERYNYKGNKSDVILDHLIPISLGGSPDSLTNLWLQPKDEATMKDKLELALYYYICQDVMGLRTAQNYLVPNWYYTYKQSKIEEETLGIEIVDPDDL